MSGSDVGAQREMYAMRRFTPVGFFVAALCVAACTSKERATTGDGGTEPSPNASILPAPLASAAEPVARPPAGEGPVGLAVDSAGRLRAPDAGTIVPRSLREDEELSRDTLTSKDSNGVSLDARFKWFDVPNAPQGAPIVVDALKRAREKTEPRMTVDLVGGRMRLALDSPAFPLPAGTEIRARSDRYGNVLVWPDGAAYRTLIPGALRAMFGERRADVSALAQAKAHPLGAGNLLGLPTAKTQLVTETGQLVLEQANISGIGSSGELLCRLLVEIIAADPATRACEASLTPVRAEYRWTGGGRLAFEVSGFLRRQDLSIGRLLVPPAGALFKPGELPPQATGVMHTREELADLRNRAIAPTQPPGEGVPGEGILIVNNTDSLAYALLDGVAIAWVRPHAEQYVIGPKPGRYTVAFRDFFGSDVEAPRPIDLPARVTLGADTDGGVAKR